MSLLYSKLPNLFYPSVCQQNIGQSDNLDKFTTCIRKEGLSIGTRLPFWMWSQVSFIAILSQLSILILRFFSHVVFRSEITSTLTMEISSWRVCTKKTNEQTNKKEQQQKGLKLFLWLYFQSQYHGGVSTHVKLLVNLDKNMDSVTLANSQQILVRWLPPHLLEGCGELPQHSFN